MEGTQTQSAEADYETYKPLLFGIAYRMLGSVMDAEDIVQEVFLSWNEREGEQVRNPKAYLCKMTTYRCIDRLRGSAKSRELYVGPWLPAPLLSELPDADGPGEAYLRKETLSTAYLLLLQQLTWAERAVFILREALQYDYEEIAGIVGKSQANCRQIFRRARKAVSGLSERPAAPGPGAETLAKRVDQFVAALTGGQPGLLVELLKREAALYSDGGGKVTAAVHPIRGAERIAAFLLGVLGKAPPDFSYRIVQINGQPGIVTSIGARPNSVLTFRMEEDAIAELYLVVNPDKLEHLPHQE